MHQHQLIERRSRYVILPWWPNFWMIPNKNLTQKENLHCFKLHQSYSISLNLSNVGNISGVESERIIPKFRLFIKLQGSISLSYYLSAVQTTSHFTNFHSLLMSFVPTSNAARKSSLVSCNFLLASLKN